MTVIGIATIVKRYSSPASNVNFKNDTMLSSLPFIFNIIVDSGVALTGTGGNPATRTGTGWSPGALIIVTNDGSSTGQPGANGTPAVVGTGGAGGPASSAAGNPGSPGGPATPATAGNDGGTALLVERKIILRNANGSIVGGVAGTGGSGAAGGGGGGGSGGGVPSQFIPEQEPIPAILGGRGGDGNTNSGHNSSWGGPPAGTGGSGGAAGASGSPGNASPGFGGGSGAGSGPGVGAAPNGLQGNAISGNSLIIYSGPTGTITGPVT